MWRIDESYFQTISKFNDEEGLKLMIMDDHFGRTEPKVFLQPLAQSSSNAGIGSYYMSLTRLPNTRIILQYLPVPHVVDSPASQKFHANPTARGYVSQGYCTTTCPINFQCIFIPYFETTCCGFLCAMGPSALWWL